MANNDQVDDNNTSQAGGRSLGGGAAEPLPSSWTHPTTQPRVGRIGAWSTSSSSRTGRFAGIQDFSSNPASSRGHGDDGDGHDQGDEPQSFFAGGERSGISVEGPGRRGNDLVRDILKKASQSGPPSAVATPSGGSRAFFGSGNTLGSDEVASEFIPDPDTEDYPESQEETAVRNITFWKDGFSVEDGPLLRYDVPENAKLLNEINAGHAPPAILNVRVGQPVELRVARRTEEDYVPSPKRPLAAFEGSGQRLGSPVPVIAGSAASQHVPGAFPDSAPAPATPNRSSEATRTHFEVDFNEPTTSVQVRLADGTRLVARMNLTHTIGDIRNFINASYAGAASQNYSIGTTFPNRTLDDNSVTIESAGLKNCVIVQRLV